MTILRRLRPIARYPGATLRAPSCAEGFYRRERCTSRAITSHPGVGSVREERKRQRTHPLGTVLQIVDRHELAALS